MKNYNEKLSIIFGLDSFKKNPVSRETGQLILPK